MALSSYQRARILLLAACCACFVLFVWASRLLAIPDDGGFSASLLQQPSPAVAILACAAVFLGCVLIGSGIAGRIRFDAGLFSACAGLTAVSARGGTMGDALRLADNTDRPTVFLLLAGELILLFALLAAGWAVQWLLHRRGLLQLDPRRDGVEDGRESLGHKLSAAVMQAVVMGCLLLVLAQSAAKQQALAAVALAAFGGSAVSYYFLYPTSPSIWYWTGPLLVGLAGYLYAFVWPPAAWSIGHVASTLSPLMRPMPLDYASAGVAGAILGYWLSRRWHRERQTAGADAAADAS